MQSELFPSSAILARLEQTPDKYLFSDKTEISGSFDGFLFYIIEIINPKENDVQFVDKVIFEAKRTVFRDSEDLYTYFERLIQRINESIDLLAKKKIDLSTGNMNAVIGCVRSNEIVISQTGKISGYLFRKDKISTITESHRVEAPTQPLKTFVHITAGQLADGDKILFANNDFFNCVSLDRARSYMAQNSPAETASEIFKNFHTNKNSTNISAVIISASSTPADSSTDIEDIVYIDKKNESLKIFWEEQMRPKLKKFYQISKRVSRKSAKEIVKNSKNISEKCQPILVDFFKKTKSYPLINQTAQKNSKHINDFLKNNKSIHINDFRGKTQAASSAPIEKNETLERFLSILRLIFQKKNKVYFFVFLIVLLSIFVTNNIKQKNKTVSGAKQEQELILKFDNANDLFNKAKQDQALGKPEYLTELNDALALALTAKKSTTNGDKANTLIAEIRVILDKEIKASHLPNPDQSFAFGENVSHIYIIGSVIYGANNDGKIYQFDTRDRESKLVASLGKDKGNIVNITGSESQNKVFIYTDKNMIFSYDTLTKVPTELKVTDNQNTWKPSLAIATFSTNIYTLDVAGNMVWRHTLNESDYSVPGKYFNKTTSLSDVISFALDGNLYLLQKNGHIRKYVRGGLDREFDISNIPGANSKIEEATEIYTSEDTSYLYVVDAKQNRIVRSDKFGEFVSQYLFDDIQLNDFVINTKIEKYWILSNSKIYEGNL